MWKSIKILKPSNYRPKWVRRTQSQCTDKLFNKIVEENFLQTKEINIHTQIHEAHRTYQENQGQKISMAYHRWNTKYIKQGKFAESCKKKKQKKYIKENLSE